MHKDYTMGKSVKKKLQPELVTVVLKKDYMTSKGLRKAGTKVKTSKAGAIELTNKKII